MPEVLINLRVEHWDLIIFMSYLITLYSELAEIVELPSSSALQSQLCPQERHTGKVVVMHQASLAVPQDA